MTSGVPCTPYRFQHPRPSAFISGSLSFSFDGGFSVRRISSCVVRAACVLFLPSCLPNFSPSVPGPSSVFGASEISVFQISARLIAPSHKLSCRRLAWQQSEKLTPGVACIRSLARNGVCPSRHHAHQSLNPCGQPRAQFSIRRPSTLANSFSSFVTRIRLCDLACAANSRSIGPTGLPFDSSEDRMSPYSMAAC
jgi:hypothetical protein